MKGSRSPCTIELRSAQRLKDRAVVSSKRHRNRAPVDKPGLIEKLRPASWTRSAKTTCRRNSIESTRLPLKRRSTNEESIERDFNLARDSSASLGWQVASINEWMNNTMTEQCRKLRPFTEVGQLQIVASRIYGISTYAAKECPQEWYGVI